MSSIKTHFSEKVSNARQVFLEFPSRSDDLQVVSVGSEHCGSEYLVDRKSFDFAVLDLVAVGSGTLSMDGDDYSLSAGSLFFYEPGVSHKIQSHPGQEMLKYFLVMEPTQAGAILERVSMEGKLFKQLPDFADLVDLFELLLINASAPSSQTPAICASLAKALLLKILEKDTNLPPVRTRAWSTYQRVLQYMRSHYKVLNSASELAKKTHLDPAHLSRMFKHFQKESPYAFLVRLKMGHAASLLIKPDTLVKDVAYELGFDNPSHFSRSFKRFHGVSPEGFIGKSKR